jgi:hypothetical protein
MCHGKNQDVSEISMVYDARRHNLARQGRHADRGARAIRSLAGREHFPRGRRHSSASARRCPFSMNERAGLGWKIAGDSRATSNGSWGPRGGSHSVIRARLSVPRKEPSGSGSKPRSRTRPPRSLPRVKKVEPAARGSFELEPTGNRHRWRTEPRGTIRRRRGHGRSLREHGEVSPMTSAEATRSRRLLRGPGRSGESRRSSNGGRRRDGRTEGARTGRWDSPPRDERRSSSRGAGRQPARRAREPPVALSRTSRGSLTSTVDQVVSSSA